ncbi:MAG: arylsulfatase [Alistipes sp.]|nr:arylsulfatase [Candidatus Alistipes equi]
MALTAACAVCTLPLGCTSQSEKIEKPNVVFLLFDDLGYGDLGCYGQQKIETPNIDALARNGVLFTDMYTAAPLSAPSRCCIMTGQHMGHSQIRGNEEKYKPNDNRGWNGVFLHPEFEGQYPMNEGTPTIAKMMKDAGYRTALVGKWGLGDPQSASTPNKMGFDYFYGFNCQALAHSYYPTYLWENDKKVETGNELVLHGEKLPEGLDPMDIESYRRYNGKYYSSDLMYDKMEKFITDNSKDPFFVMWTTTVPHSAVQAPEDEVMYYVNKLGDEAPCTDPGMYLPNRYPLATYAAMITHIDTQVGLLVKKLKELGVWDNTIFIVTSDNGPACNGNSPMEHFQSGGPFRCCKGWGKSSLHEGGIRMPFVVAWGDRLKGVKTSQMSSFVDLMPTFAELAGVQAPQNDGISFVPTLLGKKQDAHESLYWEFPSRRGNGWLAVRKGEWKGIVQHVRKGNTHMELYNLQTDPQEQTDISAEHPEIVKEMWQIIKENHGDPDNDVEQFHMDITYPEV